MKQDYSFYENYMKEEINKLLSLKGGYNKI
jgi:hypothetical protein